MEEDYTLRFNSRVMDHDQMMLAQDVRGAFKELVSKLKDLPGGRYKAVVITKLEEAAMFATKSISHG